jgi:natural product precursor
MAPRVLEHATMKKTNKLNLNRETVRSMSPHQLANVVGGDITDGTLGCSGLCLPKKPETYWCTAGCGSLTCTIIGSTACRTNSAC